MCRLCYIPVTVWYSMKRILTIAAAALCLGLLGLPTYAPVDHSDVASKATYGWVMTNDLHADHMGGGSHIICVGTACGGTDTTGQELNSDPCAVGLLDDNYRTSGIYYGDGSVVSILDKYHACEWNPWN